MNIKNITFKAVNKDFSSLAGLPVYLNIIERLDLKHLVDKVIPKQGILPFEKLKNLTLGFCAGLDCIDDITRLNLEPGFTSLIKRPFADSTMGDFLRSFSQVNIDALNHKMTKLSHKLHQKINKKNFIIYSTDATPNIQSGVKMEGLGYNYKNQWGLDSLGIYDHLGFCHALDVRAGGTHSSKKHGYYLDQVLKSSTIKNNFLHADSAYGNLETYNTLLNNKAKFVIALKDNVLKSIMSKSDLKWRKTKLQFINSDDCEVCDCRYYVDGLKGKKSLRVVILRSKKNSSQSSLINEYHYFSFVSNIEQSDKLPVMRYKKKSETTREPIEYELNPASIENIIYFYRKRGDTENFIREQKYGLDLKHYPCQSLKANKTFGLIGTLAYNLMRFSSFAISKRGCFSKKIRNLIVFHGCQVVKHARTITFKVSVEVKRRLEKIYDYLTNLLSDRVVYKKS